MSSCTVPLFFFAVKCGLKGGTFATPFLSVQHMYKWKLYTTYNSMHMNRLCLLELGSCVLAINLFCNFLVLVLVSLQTTHVLWVNNVYNSWVVWSENHATNNREYSRVHRFPALVHRLFTIELLPFKYMFQPPLPSPGCSKIPTLATDLFEGTP